MEEKLLKNVDLLQLIDSNFPFENYRPNQREVIKEVFELFKNFRYVILEAPTGSGKSPIAVTIAKIFAQFSRKTHILTIQKLLQDQYERDFKDLFVMKGKGNYICVVNEKPCTGGECRIKNNKKIREGHHCPYLVNGYKAEDSKITVHNFDSFFYQRHLFFHQKRAFMVIDEAHNLEQKFMNFVSFTINNKDFVEVQIPEYEDIDKYDEFLSTYSATLNLELIKIDEQKHLSSQQLAFRDMIESLIRKISFYLFSRKGGAKFIFEYFKDRELQKIKFKPIYIWEFTYQIFEYAENLLLMSATILDDKSFTKNVGIKDSDYTFLEMPSLFPIENRPIYITDEIDLSWKKYEEEVKKVPRIIKRYLDMYSAEKGIIHTHTNKLVNYIKRCNISNRFLFKDDFRDINSLLAVHSRKENSVIVASGFHEGLDLKDDLSRFQVILKVPYPDLKDKQISARMKVDKGYYGLLTALKLVQCYGRSVRSDEDWCDSFIIDSNFRRFKGMYKSVLPSWFMEAIQYE